MLHASSWLLTEAQSLNEKRIINNEDAIIYCLEVSISKKDLFDSIQSSTGNPMKFSCESGNTATWFNTASLQQVYFRQFTAATQDNNLVP